MLNKHSTIKLIGPMALIVIVSVLVLVGSLWLWAAQIDKSSRKHEEALFSNVLIQMTNNDARMMMSNTVWDEAVQNTSVKTDLAWIDKNYGKYFEDYLNYNHNFVLNDKGQPIYAYRQGKVIEPTHFAHFSKGIAPMISSLNDRHQNPNSNSFNFQGGLIAAGNDIYLVGASLILSSTAKPEYLRYRPFSLIGMHKLTQARLNDLSRYYMFENLKLVKSDSIIPESYARVRFTQPDGKPGAQISWQPATPGIEMFNKALFPVLLLCLSLGIVAIVLLHQSHKTAQGLIASEAKAKHLSLHDTLTGLPNRNLFSDRLIQARETMKRQGGQIAVFYVGLDRFKDVNDTLGHLAGDELIRHQAANLSGILRSCDTLARLGGDEFVILQTNADGASSASLAARILEHLTGNVTLESGMVFSTCSIGVTLIQDGDLDPSEALRQADLALYRAKEQGKGQYAFFEPEMDATIKLRKFLETGLREAIKNNTIDVVYQPQVNGQNQLIGVEALARWNHPERGAISPGYFIPLAEECGLIGELGTNIMRRAMQDAHRWGDLKVAVNVSVAQLISADYITQIKELLLETDTLATQIEIEITEGAMLSDNQATQAVLRNLRHLGFTIALDDFGTGYSSLSYLSRYPVDKIKIDRAFVSNLGNDTEAEAVVHAIVKLAKALNLNVLAEGVETQTQRSVLKSAGCSVIQGFLFSKGVNADDIDVMLAAQPKTRTRSTSESSAMYAARFG